VSDYISKEELKERLVYCRGLGRTSLEAVLKAMDNTPTISEKEIIRKAFERVVEKLKERMREYSDGTFHLKEFDTMAEAIEIVKEECGINE
jgi:predicted DNA-binding protein (UPF0278 family)